MKDKRITEIAEILNAADDAEKYMHSQGIVPGRIPVPAEQYETMRIKAEAFDKINEIMEKKEDYWWNY
ncbi:MAG: hypothetical protein IJU80_05485 [Lachnospiraceae bacterium]|nr:hypothetical protein [Lachnospiraceae bacterium]